MAEDDEGRLPAAKDQGEAPASQGCVHVIDDDEAVRRALALLLRSAGLRVATHASAIDFLDALPALAEDDIACVLTDVRMPGLDGFGLLETLRQSGFPRPVIMMTANGDVPRAVQAMKAGAADFIEKPFDDDTLLATIEDTIASAARASAAGAAAEPAGADPAAAAAARRIGALSKREREVLELIAAGKPNKVVAHELGLSPRTIEVHRARLMTRLGVRSLAEAVRLAVRAELAAGGGTDATPAPPEGA